MKCKLCEKEIKFINWSQDENAWCDSRGRSFCKKAPLEVNPVGYSEGHWHLCESRYVKKILQHYP